MYERKKKVKLAMEKAKQATDQIPDKTDVAYKQVDVASMQACQVRSIGPEYVCQCIWNDLKINDLLVSEGISKHILPLMQALVIGRLVSPGSEVHTWNWAEHRSALYELTGSPLRASLNSLYRAGDRLFDCKDFLE